jgi:hypothetical protein
MHSALFQFVAIRFIVFDRAVHLVVALSVLERIGGIAADLDEL